MDGALAGEQEQADKHSPVRITREATKLLHQNVMTLLGKRPSEEDAGFVSGAETGYGAGAGAGADSARGGRSAKRTRPSSKHKVGHSIPQCSGNVGRGADRASW